MVKPQSEFPLLEQYKRVFDITENTIFAYDGVIYSDYTLTKDLLVHEETHLKRQDKIGVDLWVSKYLSDPQFRLEEELIAYKAQLESIKDRGFRNAVRMDCATALSSDLYGGIITKDQAIKELLKK